MASEGLKYGYDKAHTGAQGGGKLGRTRDFMKTENDFIGGKPVTGGEATDEVFPKVGKGKPGKDKSLPAVKPRS